MFLSGDRDQVLHQDRRRLLLVFHNAFPELRSNNRKLVKQPGASASIALFYGAVGSAESLPVLILYLVRYGLLGAYVTLG